MQTTISVVIPIFGTVHTDRLFATLDSILWQRGISVEVIVSEQAHDQGLALQRRYPVVKHVVSRPSAIQGKEIYNAGIARNAGLKHATGEYVYFNDADILFYDHTYLQKLLEELQEGEVLVRPHMWRMLQHEVPRFLRMHGEMGLERAFSDVVFKEHYLASFKDSDEQVEFIEFDNRIFSATPEDLQRYRSDHSMRGQENLLWQRIVHCGGIFARTKDIRSVGGYSSQYPVCVYEDSDLQWKVRAMYTVREIHNYSDHAVLHLDHPLPYRSTTQEKENRDMFEKRKKRGATTAIDEDRIAFTFT